MATVPFATAKAWRASWASANAEAKRSASSFGKG
jgi:hypothetical protein